MALGSALSRTCLPRTSLSRTCLPLTAPLLTSRRHVDLLRTSSDLCPTR